MARLIPQSFTLRATAAWQSRLKCRAFVLIAARRNDGALNISARRCSTKALHHLMVSPVNHKNIKISVSLIMGLVFLWGCAPSKEAGSARLSQATLAGVSIGMNRAEIYKALKIADTQLVYMTSTSSVELLEKDGKHYELTFAPRLERKNLSVEKFLSGNSFYKDRKNDVLIKVRQP